MDGVLVIDKPCGPTSHDVVARMRRALGTRRIGHTGTLDPLATGVLPLVIGRATRLASMLSGAVKEYDAAVRFGAATPTFDAESRMVRDPSTRLATIALAPPRVPHGLNANAIETALAGFRGTFQQVAPPFSAKKTHGVPAYRRARRNEHVAPAPVTVTVERLALVGYDLGVARLQITCSAGFYVRSLAHDLGQRLGCGAHLEELRRTRAGEFSLAHSVPLGLAETEGPAVLDRMIPLAALLTHLPAAVLTVRGARRASHGNELGTDDLEGSLGPSPSATTGHGTQRWRLLDGSGTLVGIAEPTAAGLLHPVVVLV
jgi:tRNA pseudouridine55 synthase